MEKSFQPASFLLQMYTAFDRIFHLIFIKHLFKMSSTRRLVNREEHRKTSNNYITWFKCCMNMFPLSTHLRRGQTIRKYATNMVLISRIESNLHVPYFLKAEYIRKSILCHICDMIIFAK